MPTILVFGARRLGGAILDRFAEHGWNLAAVTLSDETAETVRQRHHSATHEVVVKLTITPMGDRWVP